MILQVALPHPLRRLFDYILPSTYANRSIAPGMRVKVPWGKQEKIGVIVNIALTSTIAVDKLKPIIAVLDAEAIIPPTLMQFCAWTADYYHHALGEILNLTLPPILRKQSAKTTGQILKRWHLTAEGKSLDLNTLKRVKKQLTALTLLRAHPAGYSELEFKAQGISTAIIKKLEEQHWIYTITEHIPLHLEKALPYSLSSTSAALTLNAEQEVAVTKIKQHLSQFMPFVLNGITGSGKTEVYLQVIAAVLAQNKQALVLVPEIGLTPQTVARFAGRFPGLKIAVFHSNLSDLARLKQWELAEQGVASIIIGTRSALFTPLPNLGMIIVDEAHDLSFKQQEGLRYSARDLALKRGQLLQIPVILGSATHSLDTLLQVQQQRFSALHLTERAGDAKLPEFQLLDVRKQKLQDGMAVDTLKEIKIHLEQGNQVLLFVNRRGYSPTLICHDCGWTAVCKRCDAKLTLHTKPKQQMHCHHCDSTYLLPKQCPGCHSEQLVNLGIGTERIEQALNKLFPQYPALRIDRDTTKHRDALDNMLEQIQEGRAQLLVGTQMLAKGHHFPLVTLVVILNADQGLCSSDFRATEQLAQLITQVAGRAGREKNQGKVLIQTHYPDHPLMLTLLTQGYNNFAEAALAERKLAGLPPYTAMAVFRAEANSIETGQEFLHQIKELITELKLNSLMVFGPIPAQMAKRAGVFRSLLLVQAKDKMVLQQELAILIAAVDKLKTRGKIRWHLDIDPMEVF